MARGRKATTSDAELCIKLFELRREAEMRKARNFVNFEFQPKSAQDVLKVMMAMGTQENAWLRQVFSFWDSVATLLLHDVVQPDLFLAWNGEMVFLYAKFSPFSKEIREAFEHPEFMLNVQKAVTGNSDMKRRVPRIQKMLARMGETKQTAKAR